MHGPTSREPPADSLPLTASFDADSTAGVEWSGRRSRLLRWVEPIVASEFIRQIGATALTRIVLTLLAAITSVIMTRLLLPAGRGLYAEADALAAIGAQVGILGIHSANTYHVAQDKSLLPALLANSVLLGFGAGTVVAGAMGIVVWLFPTAAPLSGVILALALAAIPLRICSLLLQALLFGVQDIAGINAIEILAGALSLAAVALFAVLGRLNVELCVAISLACALVAAVCMAARLHRDVRQPVLPSWRRLRESLSYGLRAYAACFLMYLVLKIDVLMLAYLRPASDSAVQVGYYSVAVSLGEQLCALPAIVGSLLFPRLAATAEAAQRRTAARRSAIGVALLSGALGLLLAVFARPVVWLLYGEAFLPSATAFVILMPGVVMLATNAVLMNYYAAIGLPRIVIWLPALAAAVNIALNFALIPSMGYLGAALNSTLCYGLMLALSVFSFHKEQQ